MAQSPDLVLDLAVRRVPSGVCDPFGLGFIRLQVFHQEFVELVQEDITQEWAEYTSYNVAKNAVEFSTSIPRAQLRPSYGAGFLGAPLNMVEPDDIPIERERGGRHGMSRTENDQGAGSQRHV
jgi:hypothetical protein